MGSHQGLPSEEVVCQLSPPLVGPSLFSQRSEHLRKEIVRGVLKACPKVLGQIPVPSV